MLELKDKADERANEMEKKVAELEDRCAELKGEMEVQSEGEVAGPIVVYRLEQVGIVSFFDV